METLQELRIVHSYMGLFHTLVAVSAMVFGALVFLNSKGTRKHKRLGYAYVVSMLVMNLSSFTLFNFGGFSLFHGFAVISLITLGMGIVPAMRKKQKNWFTRHFYFMNWSVVGLYCAFWAEVGTRLVEMRYFWWTVALATFLTAMVGARLINREAKKLKLV